MAARTVDFPVYDADNHLYETEEAFTRYLPDRHKDAIKYVQVNGRTKIAVNGQISEYIPNPTFEVVAQPGAPRRSTTGTATRTGSRCATSSASP